MMQKKLWFNQTGESFQGIPCDNIYGGCPQNSAGTPIIDSAGTSPGVIPTPLNSLVDVATTPSPTKQEIDLANANQKLMLEQMNQASYWSQTYQVLQDFTVDVGYCRKYGGLLRYPKEMFTASYGKATQSGIGSDSRQAGICLIREQRLIEFKAGDIIRTQSSSGPDKSNPNEIFVPYHPQGKQLMIDSSGVGGIMTILMSEYPNKLQLVSIDYLNKAEFDQIINRKAITTTNTIDTKTGLPPEYPLTGVVLPKGTTITMEDMSNCAVGGIISPDDPCKKVRSGISTGERDKTAREPRWQFKMENGDLLWLTPNSYEISIPVVTTTTHPTGLKTAGFGDNKMLLWLVAGGLALWYMNKEGYLKKILK
jgi:hypothetical protein|tara:strand:- start:1780 stop:2880 length:1101 start_codon:yes stop_codon:yes gene_type:complete